MYQNNIRAGYGLKIRLYFLNHDHPLVQCVLRKDNDLISHCILDKI